MLINGRTPEEIKHWLRWAAYCCEKTSTECATCEYSEVCGEYCGTDTYKDALALIEHYEKRIEKQNALLAVMGITIPEA